MPTPSLRRPGPAHPPATSWRPCSASATALSAEDLDTVARLRLDPSTPDELWDVISQVFVTPSRDRSPPNAVISMPFKSHGTIGFESAMCHPQPPYSRRPQVPSWRCSAAVC